MRENKKDTGLVLESVNNSNNDVANGLNVSNEAARKFTRIVSAVDNVTQRLQDIAHSAQNVTAGVENVVAAVQQQSASALHVPGAAESMTKLAMDLQSIVGQFEIRTV